MMTVKATNYKKIIIILSIVSGVSIFIIVGGAIACGVYFGAFYKYPTTPAATTTTTTTTTYTTTKPITGNNFYFLYSNFFFNLHNKKFLKLKNFSFFLRN